VYAGIDFAFSLNKRADYTAIVVIGVDDLNDIYILDIDRFKTTDITEYYEHLVVLFNQWNFKKLRAEVTVAQQIIVNDIKRRFKEGGVFIKFDEARPTPNQGTKEERMAAILEPRYQQQAVWHYRGGHIPVLEEELMLARPPHDDIKDCLASVMEIAQRPIVRTERTNVVHFGSTYNKRFGGMGTTMNRAM
jgi:hypothetical protein